MTGIEERKCKCKGDMSLSLFLGHFEQFVLLTQSMALIFG